MSPEVTFYLIALGGPVLLFLGAFFIFIGRTDSWKTAAIVVGGTVLAVGALVAGAVFFLWLASSLTGIPVT